MRGQRILLVVLASAVAGSLVFGQPGRGGSQWLTAFADAQRTSWVRADDKISVEALSKPGFEMQWRVPFDNTPRGLQGLGQGVTASGVTLFVPMSIVTGSSNNVYAIDNDIGYVVWQRQFDVPMPAPAPGCPGGITSAATRIVSLGPTATAAVTRSLGGGGRAAVGYRSLLGEPGQGVPVEGRAGRVAGPGRAGDPPGVPAPPAAGARGEGAAAADKAGAARGVAAASPPIPAARGGQAGERIPGAPRREESGPYGFLFRPSGVVYVVSSDGMLHVLGLASGKDLQRPAPFLPANSKWSAPVAVDTTLYAATSGNCGGAPNGVWAIDLDSETKPVVSWETHGGAVVGAVAFTSDGTLIAAIGPGEASADGKANAIVALDPKTLELKDWFTQAAAEFVTGPTIFRRSDRDIVAAATRDGRVVLLDAASLGGADHSTPLFVSKPFLSAGATVGGEALAAWQQSTSPPAKGLAPGAASAQAGAAAGTSWILLPLAGRPAADIPSTNGAISDGAVVALKVIDSGGGLSLQPGWVSHNGSAPATPLIVNGVVFTLATGRPSAPGGRGGPAVLHAYDGATGKRLWNSGKAMSSFASPGSFWSGLGQIYVGTHDGMLYAFGFNDERSYTNGG